MISKSRAGPSPRRYRRDSSGKSSFPAKTLEPHRTAGKRTRNCCNGPEHAKPGQSRRDAARANVAIRAIACLASHRHRRMKIRSLLRRLFRRRQPAPPQPAAGRDQGGENRPAHVQAATAAAQPEAPPAVQRVPPSQIPVVIGLDFGTFSTKIVARRRNERTATVVRLDQNCAGYPCFALPSLVRVVDGKVFFGRCAAFGDSGKLLRSLKVSLLTGTQDTTDASLGCTDALGVDGLVAIYLAWVMARIRKWVNDEYGPDGTKVFVNAAAPMDHYENPALRERYLRIVNSAWNAVWGPEPIVVEQGAPLSSLLPRFEKHLEPDMAIEPSEMRRFHVLPETVAPIVSLSHDPRMKAGMYLIVDMGAGTTELSVNHAPEPGGDKKSSAITISRCCLAGTNSKALHRATRKDLWQAGYSKRSAVLGEKATSRMLLITRQGIDGRNSRSC